MAESVSLPESLDLGAVLFGAGPVDLGVPLGVPLFGTESLPLGLLVLPAFLGPLADLYEPSSFLFLFAGEGDFAVEDESVLGA